MRDLACSVITGLSDANAQFAFGGPVTQTNGRRQLYAAVLSRLRLLMISRMAKPEEVRPPTLQPYGAGSNRRRIFDAD